MLCDQIVASHIIDQSMSQPTSAASTARSARGAAKKGGSGSGTSRSMASARRGPGGAGAATSGMGGSSTLSATTGGIKEGSLSGATSSGSLGLPPPAPSPPSTVGLPMATAARAAAALAAEQAENMPVDIDPVMQALLEVYLSSSIHYFSSFAVVNFYGSVVVEYQKQRVHTSLGEVATRRAACGAELAKLRTSFDTLKGAAEDHQHKQATKYVLSFLPFLSYHYISSSFW
jgi:hypothetical protein